MRIDELLKPGLVCCQLPKSPSRAVLQELASRVQATGIPIPSQELLDLLDKRKNPAPIPMGKGIVIYHLRTERVPELTIALATCPEGVADLQAPDALPVQAIALFLAPKKHSELYLSALAAMVEALSTPEVMARVAAAQGPEEAILCFHPDASNLERGRILSKLTEEGVLDNKIGPMLSRMSPAELADLLDDLPPRDRGRCLGVLEPTRAADVTHHMPLVPLTATLRRMPAAAAARILSYVPSSRCTDVLQRMPLEEQSAVLKQLGNGTHKAVQWLLKYPPYTAGGIMTPEVLSVPEGATVAEALRKIAGFQDRRQTDVYVTTAEGGLVGWCQFHDLAGAEPGRPVADFLKRNIPTVPPERDQEDLLKLLAHDEAQSIAVVGASGKLFGIITEDALLSAMEQEANEDLQQIVGSKFVDPIHTPLDLRVRLRLPWLLLTLTGELVIALVIAKVFRATLERAAVLAAFMPAIMATGGNVGLQSTTLVIRSLATGRLKSRHAMRLVLGELKLGVILGLACGLLAGGAAHLITWGHGDAVKVGVCVLLAMLSATLATSLAGTAVPILLHRMKRDPAMACGPFVTLFNDMFGSLVYLFIAMLLFST